MGSDNSTPSQPQPPPSQPLTDLPWRQPSNWTPQLEQKLIAEIRAIHPREKANLLASGAAGAGKSAFINAVFSIGEGRKVSRAQTGSSASSFTLKYTGYTQNTLLKDFILRDTMGVEPKADGGFHVDDFIYLVKGHIENNYKFNSAQPISPGDKGYRDVPLPGDKIHCVIFVISAVDIDSHVADTYARKIGQLQDKLRMEQIPRILILTKADILCEQVKKNITNMFRSKRIQQVVKTASEIFSIDQSSIHPVVNYEVDYTLTPEKSIPLLLALKQSMDYAYDRLEQVQANAEIR